MTKESKLRELSEKEKNELLSRFVNELPVLRTKLGLSQDDMANLIGVSRQTYSSIETQKRKMSWSLYLSMILIFDYNEQTHDLIHDAKLFPQKLLKSQKQKDGEQTILSFLPVEGDELKNQLDEQAMHAIETVIMVEYARCNQISGEAVIRAFDGKRMTKISEKDIQAQKALSNIKSGSSAKKEYE